jgi:hypothetical protein
LLDGLYRESIGGNESAITGMKPKTDTDAALVIEAANPGKTILSGSEIRTGWSREGDIWVGDWPYKDSSPAHNSGRCQQDAIW